MLVSIGVDTNDGERAIDPPMGDRPVQPRADGENDIGFAKILLDAARQKGFKGVVSTTGAAALAMIREYQPAVLTLDIYLPDMQGWRVLERLKVDLATRHIPVCVVSTDDARDRALNSGALGFIAKPLTSRDLVDQALEQLKDFVNRPSRQVLLMMPDGEARHEVIDRLGAADIGMLVAWSRDEATSSRRRPISSASVVGSSPSAGTNSAETVA